LIEYNGRCLLIADKSVASSRFVISWYSRTPVTVATLLAKTAMIAEPMKNLQWQLDSSFPLAIGGNL
jgi:hypothetical protein